MRGSLRGKINKSNLSEQTVQAIKARILSFDYEPGRRIAIETLSEELGISFTPVRDAIRELVTQGYIDYDGNSHKVRVYSRREIDDLFAIRSALEVLAVELASQRLEERDLDALRSICEQSEKAMSEKNFDNLTSLDIEFHEKIANSARNDQLGKILNNIRERSWYIRRWVFGMHKHEQDEYYAVTEHKAILEKLMARDVGGVVVCMREHMRNSEDRTLRTLPDEQAT